jgi:hypothetical protein
MVRVQNAGQKIGPAKGPMGGKSTSGQKIDLKQKIFNVAFLKETNLCKHDFSEIIRDIEKKFFVSFTKVNV